MDSSKGTNNAERNAFYLGLGVLFLLVAITLQTVSLASGRYATVLLGALAFTLLADLCLLQAFRRGGLFVRCISLVFLLPTIFIVLDFIRRASAAFG